MIISFTAHKADKNSTAWEATNSSAKNNYIHGAGSVKHHYSFGNGYRDSGAAIDTSGNSFNIPALISEFR